MIASGRTPRPRALGWGLFVVGTVVAIASVERWARILPAIFAPAILNGLLILADGHALNQPTVPFPRREAAVFLALMVVAAYTTAPFANARLTKSDKFACVGILACGVVMFLAIFLSVSRWEKPLGFSLLVCLGVIWAGRISRARA